MPRTRHMRTASEVGCGPIAGDVRHKVFDAAVVAGVNGRRTMIACMVFVLQQASGKSAELLSRAER